MPSFFTDEEVSFIEELNREIDFWEEVHSFSLDDYPYSDDEEENRRNQEIRGLSNEIFKMYFQLKEDIEDKLWKIHTNRLEYDRLTTTDK